MEAESPFDYVVDVDNRICIFNCGWVSDIVSMLDDDGDETEDVEEAIVLIVKIPGGYMTVDMLELMDDEAPTIQ